jgi:hypothetical protein
VTDQGDLGRLAAAAATVDLTPAPGLPLGGYVQRAGAAATGTHDPLQGNLVWIRDMAGGEVLWVTLDALSVDGPLVASVREVVSRATGCAPESVVVCASHTHSSAAGWVGRVSAGLPDTSDEALRRRLVEQLGEAASQLPDRLEPCGAVLGEGQAPAAGGNRNDPGGPHDASVGILGLIDDDGRLAAGLVDYASHATVLGYVNRAWSADYPGAARRLLATALAGAVPFAAPATQATPRPPVIAFLQGAAGDASPRFVRRNQGFGEVDRLGGLVAAGAMSGLLTAAPPARSGRVVVARRTVSVPTRELPPAALLADRVTETERAWHEAQATGAAPADERIARTRHEGALVLQALAAAALPPSLDATLTAVAIGTAAWVHLPVELFASLGLAIREASPFAWTRVIGYSNDYLGYVADAAGHRDGVYEALASNFDADAGQVLVEAAVALLHDAYTAAPGVAAMPAAAARGGG